MLAQAGSYFPTVAVSCLKMKKIMARSSWKGVSRNAKEKNEILENGSDTARYYPL